MQGTLSLMGSPQLISVAQALQAKGELFALATVVARRSPVSSQVGDKAIITADGTLTGWIGGSCSQPVVKREALAALREGQPRLVRMRTDEVGEIAPLAGITHVAMTCPSGGEVEIFIEPVLPRPLLLAFGETPLVRALAQMAPVVGLDFLSVDDVSGLTGLEPGAIRSDSFAVVATAGHFDEEALTLALRTEARYIALVASARRTAAVLEVLQATGLQDTALARIRRQPGLDLGARSQEEIALELLAEIVRERRGPAPAAQPGALVDTMPAPDDLSLPMAAPLLARDPICGMEVEVAGARHTYEHDGQTYYFCCPHCRTRFAKDPVAALEAGGMPVG